MAVLSLALRTQQAMAARRARRDLNQVDYGMDINFARHRHVVVFVVKSPFQWRKTCWHGYI